jgi:hypothetical protein
LAEFWVERVKKDTSIIKFPLLAIHNKLKSVNATYCTSGSRKNIIIPTGNETN